MRLIPDANSSLFLMGRKPHAESRAVCGLGFRPVPWLPFVVNSGSRIFSLQVQPNSPPDEEGTPERSEGGEVIQLKHFVIRRIVGVGPPRPRFAAAVPSSSGGESFRLCDCRFASVDGARPADSRGPLI